eukprot:7837475-Pyramimonas_sp.AAC.1
MSTRVEYRKTRLFLFRCLFNQRAGNGIQEKSKHTPHASSTSVASSVQIITSLLYCHRSPRQARAPEVQVRLLAQYI